VRTILAGHLHYSTTATFAGIGVSVAAAACYTQDLAVIPGSMSSRDGGQAVNLVHVYGDTVMHSIAPLGDFPPLRTVSPQETADQLESAGIAMPPFAASAFSQGAASGK
jgi:hypothetical protein